VAARVAAGDQNAAARGFALRRGSEPTQATTRPRSRVAEVRGTRAGSDVRVAREAPSRRAGEGHERVRLPGRGRAPLRRGGAARDRARGLPERRRHRFPCRGHVCRCDLRNSSRHASPSSTRYVTTARDGRATPFPECLRTTRAEAGNPIHAYRGLPALGAVRVRTAPFQKFLLSPSTDLRNVA
jgi:hypothetical protein